VIFLIKIKNIYTSIIKGIIIHFMIDWFIPLVMVMDERLDFFIGMLKRILVNWIFISTIIKDTKNQYESFYVYWIDQNDMTYFITYHLKQWKSIQFERIHRSKAKKKSYKPQSLLRSKCKWQTSTDFKNYKWRFR
jgi:hypothetical protein